MNIDRTHHLLEEMGFLDHIYNALKSMDMSAAVFLALQGMRMAGSLSYGSKTEKNALESSKFRTDGNEHYTNERYLEALQCYNKALLFAPSGSIELVLAYSNRSALLLKLAAYSASCIDIETCLKLGCTGDLLNKLNKRKMECTQVMWKETLKSYAYLNGPIQEFFKLNKKRHPEIPCLSDDLDIVSESGERKVVAAKDIAVGSVVAIETAFTTHSLTKPLVTCHYCQKMSLNLIPCENCCFALFCSTECQTLCANEYHDIECQIMDILVPIEIRYFRLSIKTVLKLIKKCETWSKLIEESKNIGASRLNSSTVGQIYNVENYSSILCFKEDRRFIYGLMYNCSFMYATVLHYLEKIPGFFPSSPTDLEAKKCFAELCMRIGIECSVLTGYNDSAENVTMQRIEINYDVNNHCGLFPLTGKLRHSCDPNVLVIGLNNRIALVAIKPIKNMTEITVSKIGHYYECMYNRRAPVLYQCSRGVCRCRICLEQWGMRLFKKELTSQHKKFINEWKKIKHSLNILQDPFKNTCYTLSKLEDLENTEEHVEIYEDFRTKLGLFQYAATLNATIFQTKQ